MTSEQNQEGHEGQLREEAATWWAVMHGEDADRRQAEFDAWLNRGTYHRSAYNRIAEIHAIGKHLKDDPELAAPLPPTSPKRTVAKRLIPIALFASGILAGAWSYREISGRQSLPPIADASGSMQPFAKSTVQLLSTRVGEIRPINLEDGTLLILDTDSVARVSFRPDLRSVSLERGRARIRLAGDPRPFRLSAGQATVIASNGQFDIDRTSNRETKIIMISGSAQVTALDAGGSSLELGAGQAMTIAPGASGAPIVSQAADAWPTGSIDVDNMTLADLVRQANRYSTSPIVIADPAIGSLRISGHFRINDTASLANRLAALFDLSAQKTEMGGWVLQQK